MQKAREKLGFDKQENAIAPFVGQLSTPDRVFVYKGTEAAEKGRLIHSVVTPWKLAVQRAKKGNAEDIGLWVPRPFISPISQGLLSRAAGEFAIAPDSATLATPQADNLAILSLISCPVVQQ